MANSSHAPCSSSAFAPYAAQVHAALVRACWALRRSSKAAAPAIFTADGPRGPIYRTKSGPIKLAMLTGARIGAFHLEPEHAWILKSWDRFFVPRPFTRIVVSWSRWTHVPADLPDGGIRTKARRTECGHRTGALHALAHLGQTSVGSNRNYERTCWFPISTSSCPRN